MYGLTENLGALSYLDRLEHIDAGIAQIAFLPLVTGSTLCVNYTKQSKTKLN